MVKRSDAELDRKAAEFEAWADGLDADDFEGTDDLRAAAEAAAAVATAYARVTKAVAIARAHGRNWGENRDGARDFPTGGTATFRGACDELSSQFA